MNHPIAQKVYLKTIILSSIYTPVCLPSPADTFYGSASVTTGWGLISPAHCTVPDICPPPPPEPRPMETDVLQVCGVFTFSTQSFVYVQELSAPILGKSECENILNEVSGASGQSWHQFLCVGDGKGTVSTQIHLRCSTDVTLAQKNNCKLCTRVHAVVTPAGL